MPRPDSRYLQEGAIQHELPHWHCYNAPERTGLWWNHQNTNRVLLMYFSVSFPFIFVQLPKFGNWTMFSKKNSHNFKSLSCPLPSKFEHWLPSKIEQLKNICKGPAASGKGRRSTLPHEITNASTNSLWQATLNRVRSTPPTLPKWICGAPASQQYIMRAMLQVLPLFLKNRETHTARKPLTLVTPVQTAMLSDEVEKKWHSYREEAIKNKLDILEKCLPLQSCQGHPSGLRPPVNPWQG